jgi:hypothetical protein
MCITSFDFVFFYYTLQWPSSVSKKMAVLAQLEIISPLTSRYGLGLLVFGPCLDAPQKLKFFHSLSITSIFGSMHEVINVGKK